MVAKPDTALLIVGHGSTVNPDSSTPTLAHAAEIRCREIFVDVGCAFWKEEPSLREAIFLFDPESLRAKVSYNWLSSGRDWTDPTPKFLAATYMRPKSKLPSPDERRFGGFVVSVYFDGQLQDARAVPQELLTMFPAPD